LNPKKKEKKKKRVSLRGAWVWQRRLSRNPDIHFIRTGTKNRGEKKGGKIGKAAAGRVLKRNEADLVPKNYPVSSYNFLGENL